MCARGNQLCASFLVGLASRCQSAAASPPRPSSVRRLNAPWWAERGSFAPGLPQPRSLGGFLPSCCSGLLGARKDARDGHGPVRGTYRRGMVSWAPVPSTVLASLLEGDVPLMIRVGLTSPLCGMAALWQPGGALPEPVAPGGPGRAAGTWAALPSSLPPLHTVI